MKGRYEVNSPLLIEEIKYSLEVLEKTGKHTDKLGYMLMSLTEILFKRYDLSLHPEEIRDIKQEVIIEMIVTINRKGLQMEDPFNYLYYVGRLKIHEQLMLVRKKENILNKLQGLIEKEQEYINTQIVTE